MLEKLFPKPAYLRLFLLLALIVTITVLVFSFILTRLFSNYAQEEIDEFSRQRIEQIDRNTEFTLKKIMLYGLRMYEDKGLKDWLLAEKDNPELQHKALTVLTDYLAVEPFIRTVYLANEKTERVFSSQNGVSDFSDFSDPALLRAISDKRHSVLQYENFATDRASHLLLTIPAGTSHQGRLSMSIDKEKVQDYLLLLNNEYHSKIFIVDETGKTILGNVDSDAAKAVWSHADKAGRDGTFRWEGPDQSWTVRYTAMNMSGWEIYHMLPTNILQDKVSSLNRTLLSIISVMLIVLFAAIFWSSRANYKPLKELTAMLQQKLGHSSHPKSGKLAEYRVIESGVHHLFNRMNQLDLSLKNSKRLVLEEQLRQWILSGKLHDSTSERIGQETQLLQNSHLQLAVIRIEKYSAFSEQYDFASRKLLKYAMGNICMELMENARRHGEFVDLASDHLLLLLASSPTDNLIGLLEEIKTQIAHWLSIDTTVAVSKPADLQENLSYLYKHVLELSMLRFLNGADKIYTEDDLEADHAAEPVMWEQHVKELIQAVRLRNQTAMESYLQVIKGQLHGLSYQECKLQLTQIVYRLMRTFKQLGELQGMDGIRQYLDRFSSLQDVMRWIKHELNEIIRELNPTQKSNRKEELYREMIEYVKQHIFDPMLTVEELAEHISISGDYARKIFKDFHELSLSDYMTFERVEHVKKMLLETTMPAIDIAERCGFQSKSHFYTAFKKWTGLTPNQYRMHHNEHGLDER